MFSTATEIIVQLGPESSILAAKMAFLKALQKLEISPLPASDEELEVSKDAEGNPYFIVSGKTKALLKKQKLECHLSLSHDGGKVAAFVVLA